MPAEDQSPIDLMVTDDSIVIDRPSTSYHALGWATVTDTGSTLSVGVEPGGILMMSDRRFTLTEIHSHSPSEHLIRGERADIETHLVHTGPDGIAVIALLSDAAGGDHPIDFLVDPPSPGGTEKLGRAVSLDKLLPRDSRRFLYTGSLTTPPYTGGVQWIVYERIQTVGREALARFRDRYPDNHRQIQPLGDREVLVVRAF